MHTRYKRKASRMFHYSGSRLLQVFIPRITPLPPQRVVRDLTGKGKVEWMIEMAKVHSLVPSAPADAACSPYAAPKGEAFTVWMKSLVMQGNGCTVFNQKGEIVYRMDNYEKKGSREVFLMDLRGKVLFTIIQRKLRVFGRWEGYKCSESDANDGNLWFRVKKGCPIFKKRSSCQVSVHSDNAQARFFNIESTAGKPEFSIVNRTRGLIAEGKRKQSSSGVYLGEDVLALAVEPEVDHSLVVALVAVFGSMHRRM